MTEEGTQTSMTDNCSTGSLSRKFVPSYGVICFRKNGAITEVLVIRTRFGWSFPKGHAESGETPAQTAAREAKEETAVTVSVNTDFAYTVPSARPGDKNTVTFFLGVAVSSAPPVAQAGEVQESCWLNVCEVRRGIGFAPDALALDAAAEYWQRLCR